MGRAVRLDLLSESVFAVTAGEVQRRAARDALSECEPSGGDVAGWYSRMAATFDSAAGTAPDDARSGLRQALSEESSRRAEVLRGNGFADWLGSDGNVR